METLEKIVFGFFLASPWLFLTIGIVCILASLYLSPVFKGVYKPKEQAMTEQSGCALMLAGIVILGIAAILWQLGQ